MRSRHRTAVLAMNPGMLSSASTVVHESGVVASSTDRSPDIRAPKRATTRPERASCATTPLPLTEPPALHHPAYQPQWQHLAAPGRCTAAVIRRLAALAGDRSSDRGRSRARGHRGDVAGTARIRPCNASATAVP
jgi:hypothetical protein